MNKSSLFIPIASLVCNSAPRLCELLTYQGVLNIRFSRNDYQSKERNVSPISEDSADSEMLIHTCQPGLKP